MLDRNKVIAALPSLILGTLTMGSIVISAVTYGDDAPPGSPPAEHSDRHHDPAWAACKSRADEQKLAPGDARHEFMKSCIKSSHAAAPVSATP